MTDYPRHSDRQPAQATSTPPEDDVRSIALNRISWGAVAAGVVVALVVQLLLNLLGLGIGVATLDPGTGDTPSAGALSTAAAIWYLLAGIIAAYAGGYMAGRLSGGPLGSTSALHGLTAWAATTLVMFYLLTTAVGGIIGGVFSGVSGALSGVGRSALSAAQVAAPGLATATDPFSAIEQQVREASGSDPAELRNAAVTALRAALTGDEARAQEARERAAQALARAQNISAEEAQKKIADYEQQYRQTVEEAKQQAVQAAQTTAKIVSRGALLSFLALVLGAIAAWFGGRSGTVIPTITSFGLPQASSSHQPR
jgi:hypothetical protein